MKRVLVVLVLVGAGCSTWQGTPGDRSSSWTWACGGEDDDTPAPDSGCPMVDAAITTDVDGGE